MGGQDFNPQVQLAVNRIQSAACTPVVIDAAQGSGFRSINIDLIYGLPHQTPSTFRHTVDRIVGSGPDRIAVFNDAHLPARFKVQRRIDARALPDAAEKPAIVRQTTEQSLDAGYCYIGLDHLRNPKMNSRSRCVNAG